MPAGTLYFSTPMKNELDILRDVSMKMERLDVPYMLTGSMAMNYYAEPRMTRDIDLVIALLSDQVQAFLKTFAQDYYVSEDAVASAIRDSSVFNLIHLEAVIKVDCVIRKSSEYRRLEFDRRRQISLGDFSVYIVGKEDLILSKLAWARDSRSGLQMDDVRNLLRTGYDENYTRHWAGKLGVDDLLYEAIRE